MYLKKTAIKIIKGEYTMKNFKKFLSGITALTMLSSLCVPACAATVTTLGDLNNDGSVNIKHTVILDSEDEQHLEFLKQVFSDVPQSIFILKNRLEK